MHISTLSFKANGYIPSKYTCEGEDISPQLSWSGIPENTKSLVLIVDDPDAPVGTWVHWVVYNIPPTVREFPAGSNLNFTSVKEGLNDFGKNFYMGPCPPPGKPHRYFFKLYAVDIPTDFKAGLSKKKLLNLIKDYIIDSCEIVGLYKR